MKQQSQPWRWLSRQLTCLVDTGDHEDSLLASLLLHVYAALQHDLTPDTYKSSNSRSHTKAALTTNQSLHFLGMSHETLAMQADSHPTAIIIIITELILTGPWRSWRESQSGCESSPVVQGSCWTGTVKVQTSRSAANAQTIAGHIQTQHTLVNELLTVTTPSNMSKVPIRGLIHAARGRILEQFYPNIRQQFNFWWKS